MASITLTIPDAQVSRVIEALCAGTVITEPRPESAANAKAVVVELVTDVVLQYERKKARLALAQPDVTGLVT